MIAIMHFQFAFVDSSLAKLSCKQLQQQVYQCIQQLNGLPAEDVAAIFYFLVANVNFRWHACRCYLYKKKDYALS